MAGFLRDGRRARKIVPDGVSDGFELHPLVHRRNDAQIKTPILTSMMCLVHLTGCRSCTEHSLMHQGGTAYDQFQGFNSFDGYRAQVYGRHCQFRLMEIISLSTFCLLSHS
jgi:hypothetical protein